MKGGNKERAKKREEERENKFIFPPSLFLSHDYDSHFVSSTVSPIKIIFVENPVEERK
jgi:hypothetical protein